MKKYLTGDLIMPPADLSIVFWGKLHNEAVTPTGDVLTDRNTFIIVLDEDPWIPLTWVVAPGKSFRNTATQFFHVLVGTDNNFHNVWLSGVTLKEWETISLGRE